MSRITEILKQKKLQGKSWDDLADCLPIGSAGLRAAFSRGSVSSIYLEVLEKVLKINQEKITIEPKPKDQEDHHDSGLYGSIKKIVLQIMSEEIDPLKQEVEMIRQDINLIFTSELEKVETKMSSKKSSRKTS